MKDGALKWAGVLVFGVVVSGLWINQKTHGQLGRSLSQFGTLSGTFVCADLGMPLTIKIRNGKADVDLGVATIRAMKVEQRGSTLALSGGVAYDGLGNYIDKPTRIALTGGNDVDLYKLGDDGMSLSLDAGEGRRVVFVKQPD